MTGREPAAHDARYRRHPAEVTADRLADAMDKWPDRFDGSMRDDISRIRTVLQDIAEGTGEGSW